MAEEYDVQAIMNVLKEKSEMDPDQHDGCYELMRETITAYSKLKDFSMIDYRDLNLVYLTTVGTWKQGIESKKKTVQDSHLLSDDKEYLSLLWDDIWDKTINGEYSNNELDASGNGSIGLFGTGFFSFQRTTTKEDDHNIDKGESPAHIAITGVREIILDAADKISYERIYEAINATVGTNYTGWMKACWPSNNPSQPFRIWFTKLAETQNGKLVPAAYDCLNTISGDWNEFIFDDLKKGYVEGGVRYKGYSLIFAKEPNGGLYLFRGVYYEDTILSSPNHYIYKRIGTRVKLIGSPSSKIEILDDFRKK